MSRLRVAVAALEEPLPLAQNRVARFYSGGALLESFRGFEQPTDSNEPEDWVGSVTSAWRPSGSPPVEEGLSRVVVDGTDTTLRELLLAEPEAIAGRELLASIDAQGRGTHAPTTGLLVKLLDSGIRLPVHGHPTRAFARRHLGSIFGKTEAWLVVATRNIPGQEAPHVRIGFRREVARDELRAWIEQRDSAALLGSMHRREVTAGDTWLIPAGTLHSIGAGVFLVELQEPTDFSIVAETAGFPIAMDDAHLGLGWDVMLDAFDRRELGERELDALRGRPIGPRESVPEHGLSVLGPNADAYFRALRLVVRGERPLPEQGFSIGIVLAGEGAIRGRRDELHVSRGSTFALPAAAAPHVSLVARDTLDVLFCLPPRPELLRAG